MSVFDTMVAGLSGAGLVLLGVVATHGTSEYHLNAAQIEAQLQTTASSALNDAGHDWASVTMDGMNATMGGFPPSPEEAAAAEQVVFTSAGKGGPIWGGVLGVETDYADAPEIATVTPFVWRAVKGETGRVSLLGHAPDEDARTALQAQAGGMSADVSDRMDLGLGVPDGEWLATAIFGMEQLALLDSGEARLTDYELRLSGVAMEDAARIQASASIANLQSPWTGVASIAGPTLWKAEHIDGALILSGSCETPEDKAEIASIANQYYSGEVRDEMTVASSEHQDWTQGVRLGLPHFSKFQSGEMAYEPEALGFTFEGEATASTLQYLREDMATLGDDIRVDIAAETVAVELAELQGVDLGEDPLIACQSSFNIIMDANAVVFNTGSAEISRVSGDTLDKIMAVSASCAPNLVYEVAGHTDNTGDPEANQVLSQARAQAVANYMSQTGFDAERLLVVGYGSDQPTADNGTPEGQAKNRRIEFNVQERSE